MQKKIFASKKLAESKYRGNPSRKNRICNRLILIEIFEYQQNKNGKNPFHISN
jgi:hypothetical protein